MEIVPFSHDLCQELLNKGYSYFAVPRLRNKFDESWTPETILTFEALRYRPQSKAVPIKHIMDLPEERAKQYNVIIER